MQHHVHSLLINEGREADLQAWKLLRIKNCVLFTLRVESLQLLS